MEVNKIADNVWKFTGTDKVNLYFIDFGNDGGRAVIDTGNRADRQDIIRLLGSLTDLSKVGRVIFTHLHHDHTGNFDLFPNAEFYASEREIKDFKRNREETVLGSEIADRLNIELKPLPAKVGPLEVINTPGHTAGSVCILYPEKKILFTGDTLFPKKQLGRTDLPTSVPSEMNNSLIRLLDYDFKILAPGHDY